uniref:Uncharacterized protein n=2 Tax=Araneus ventricosus TaxID=182803 RepID=A0A4Y2PZ56_ARAVE|nr:hypothetical protein AVEN_270150-1 [Araneus ventricosus]
MKQADALDFQSTLSNNLKNSPIHHETISSMKETDSFDAKRTLLNDSKISTTHTEDISVMKQTDSVDAKMISLNDSTRTTTQTETVSAMKQTKALDAKRSLINDVENSHVQTEITKRRIEKVEDLGWHEVEHKGDKISSRLLQDANIGKYETFTSENGKNENEFIESSYKKKIKLEDDIIEAKLSQTASKMKQTLLEDLSTSEKSQKVYFYSNGVSGMKEKEISVNEVSSKISVDGGDWNGMNGNLTHNISKINCDMNRFESAAKGTEDSKNRSSKFSVECLDSDTETYSSHIDKTEINASFRASDIKTKTSQVESISKTSVDFDSEKINSSERKHFETVDEVHYNGNCREKMSRDSHLTDEASGFAFSQGKRGGVILNNQISSSFSSEVNNLSKLDNKIDLSCSVQNKNESVVTEMLSNEKSKNLGMSHSEMKFDSQTETLMTLDSPNPFPTANNASALAKPQGMQTELPVASKLASQEPADANIPLDTTADRKADAETRITSDGTEGNEKQCQVCHCSLLFLLAADSCLSRKCRLTAEYAFAIKDAFLSVLAIALENV